MTAPAAPPEPPYYAVIFAWLRSDDDSAYARMADEMAALAARQPGYLGMDTARGADGFGMTVSYWRDRDAIRAWKAHAEHRVAQRLGAQAWYDAYAIRVARIERAYSGPRAGA